MINMSFYSRNIMTRRIFQEKEGEKFMAADFQQHTVQSDRPEWMDDPMVSHISDEKKMFLMRFKDSTAGLNKNRMMMVVMNMMKEAKANNITFTPEEIQVMIQAIKKHASEEENAKIDNILKKASKSQ